eukprot:NODE_5088_length_603_cov_53.989170_g4393_i0.p2 GENE.NODE_5088_length_603_cov_53.989170_g4393_i0~~NODE_5088_length_603_cov_53.989170_g4393_i0.p2  ORF type:complete len:161 (-),score=30.50 NODE_5088_length_603_cov_53.989170_g4393_i0:48-530(-)
MLRTRSLFSGKSATLLNVILGNQGLKDQVPVKEASLARIFGEEWRSELNTYFQGYKATLDKEKGASLEKKYQLQLKRIELTGYTRHELTTLGFLANGTRRVATNAQEYNVASAKQRLADLIQAEGKEHGIEKFRSELAREAKLAQWPKDKTDTFIKMVGV